MAKEYYLGIDIGSAFSKAVVLEGRTLASFAVIPTGGNYRATSDEVIHRALEKAGISLRNIYGVSSTGYGGTSVIATNRSFTDITCTSRGVHALFPSARTVIDVGSQYTRVIRLNAAGRNTDFVLSERCAGGSGRLFQTIAHVLQIRFEDIGLLSLKSENPVSFNTGCAVFAETEAVSRMAEGEKVEDILAGVNNALAGRIQSLLERLGPESDIVLTGGGAKNVGLVAGLRKLMQTDILVPEEPQISAALGAALMAAEMGTL